MTSTIGLTPVNKDYHSRPHHTFVPKILKCKKEKFIKNLIYILGENFSYGFNSG